MASYTKKANQSKQTDLGELITTKISILKSFLSSNNAVAKAIVETAIVLPINIALGVKPADLTAEPGWKLGRIKTINEVDPTLAREELVVVSIDVVTENRDKTHAGNHDALLWVLLALGSRNSGSRRGADEGDLLGNGSGSDIWEMGPFAKRV